jgi:type IV secretory pathway VirB4 component
MIPIFEENQHELVSLKGEKSQFFELTPLDIEGKALHEKERIFEAIEESLRSTKGVLKFYYLNRKLFVNAFCDFDLPIGKLTPCKNPLATFLGASSTLQVYDNYLTQGFEFCRLMAVKSYPAKLNFLEFSGLDYVINFSLIDKKQAKSQIDLRRKMNFSALFKDMRDLESENAFYEAQTLLEGVTKDELSLFKTEMFFIVKGMTKHELDQKSHELCDYFESLGGELITEERGLSLFYQTLIPGVMPSFKRAQVMPSDYLSILVPFHRDYLFDGGLRLHARSMNPIYFDLFHQTNINFNVLITGSSGQGKSMLANALLKYERERETKAIVLDLGNSFLKNAKYHEGVIFSEKFNPLQFKDARYLKEFVMALIDEKMSKKDEGHLFEVITMLIDKVTSIDEFIDGLEIEFQGIKYYFSEIRDYLTDEQSQVYDFTYCDFSNYPEAIKAPLIIYLIQMFKELSGKKIFIFDECWHLLAKNADYIAECFRTFRKQKASAVAISQNLDDFSLTQLGRVIMQNTYFKFLFKQSITVNEYVGQHALELLNSVQGNKGVYSEALLISDEITKVVRYVSDPLDYELFHTDKNELLQFDRYMQDFGQYLDFKKAIHNFTAIKYPSWSHYEA